MGKTTATAFSLDWTNAPTGEVYCPMKMSGIAVMACAHYRRANHCGTLAEWQEGANGGQIWPWLEKWGECKDRAQDKEIAQVEEAVRDDYWQSFGQEEEPPSKRPRRPRLKPQFRRCVGCGKVRRQQWDKRSPRCRACYYEYLRDRPGAKPRYKVCQVCGEPKARTASPRCKYCGNNAKRRAVDGR